MDIDEKLKPRSPIMKLMGSLHYYHKFGVISLLFGFAILFSLYFMVTGQIQQARTAALELTGIRYLEGIQEITEGILKHRELLSQLHEGKQSIKGEILSIQAQVSSNFRELVHRDEEAENIIDTTLTSFQYYDLPNLKPDEIERQWNALARDSFDLPLAEANKQHLLLIDELLSLLSYVSDRSGLLLDDQRDTYFLINTAVNLLPQAQQLIPRINIAIQSASQENRLVELISLTANLRQNLDETRTSTDKSYSQNEEDEVENHLREPLRQYINSGNDYLSFIYNDVISNSDFDSNTLRTISSKTINDNFAFWYITADQIELLLQNRVSLLTFQMYWRSALAICMALIAFLFGIHVLGEAMRPISLLMTATKELADGNLSTRVPIIYRDTIGELSEAINTVAESFQSLISQLQWTGIQLTTSTTQIAAAAKQQEATVVQQEATTKEIAVTAREISATAKDFAKTMSEVSKTAEQTSANASGGKEALEQMQTIMHQLVDASSTISTKLGALNEKAGTITGVVTTITKVADQTNLLSLNAAIEAEKAGEHGRSFAVIAREIRRLADQTANATYDIEKMVTEMVSAVSAGVMGVDKFSAEITNAVEQVNTVSEHLTQIIEQVQVQTASFESVNQGMQAQSLGAEQINESIIQLSEVAQQTADSIRQFHRAVEQLNNAAQEMQNSVVKLQQ